MPLRPPDIVELNQRQQYIEQAGSVIPDWALDNPAYAGYYVNHGAGGIIHVGFTHDQLGHLLSLKGGLTVPVERLEVFPFHPQFSYARLLSAQYAVASAAAQLPNFTQAPIDVEHNRLQVGITGTLADMSNALQSVLGPNDGSYAAFFDSEPPGRNVQTGRHRLAGRIRAGDRIASANGECTANFGAWQEHYSLRGKRVAKHFLLTAGHCAHLGEMFSREKFNDATNTWEHQDLGRGRRQGIEGDGKVDALAILLQGKADGWAPRQIYLSPTSSQPVSGIALPTPGMIVSVSGATTDKVLTGEVLGPPVPFTYTNYAGLTAYQIPISIRQRPGDSGGPVWQSGTGNAIGLWNAGTNPSFIAPLLPYPVVVENNHSGVDLSPGALAKLGFSPNNLSFSR